MPRNISAPLLAAYESDSTTLSYCMILTRQDATVFRFTDHDRDIEFEGDTYVSAQGFDGSAIAAKAGLQVDNAEAVGFLDDAAITESDLRAGVWDHAEFRLFQVDRNQLGEGRMRHLRGWIGEFTLEGDRYTAELRNLAAVLNSPIGEIVTAACQASVGDARCTVVMTDYTTTGEVTAVTSARVFDTDLSGATVRLTPSTTGAPDEDYFAGGVLTWLTGVNAGRSMEVRNNDVAGKISLQLAMSDTPSPGDTFSVYAGCPKSIAVCESRFGNVLNFRGFPWVPGVDKVLKVGGQ
jgi:uncharacterized phage protein (TIGR02218 family)